MSHTMNYVSCFQPWLKKSIAAIQSILLITASLIGVMPLVAHAGAANYQIFGSATPNGLTVNISGEASANPFKGRPDDQFVSVDWDNNGTADEVLADNTDFNFTDPGVNGSFASSSWSGPHTYTTSGTKIIEVRVHHANFNGNESERAGITFTLEIFPQCNDNIDNDGDGFVDFDGNGGAPDPGCTSASDDSESPNPVTTGTLTLQKTIINDSGGTATDTAWTLSANGPTPISGVEGSAAVTGATVSAGTYDLSESGGPSGYNASSWVCSGTGTQNDSNTVTLAAGQNATCTITNDDNEPALTLVKVVTNDNGGTEDESAWSLTASGPTGFSGAGPSVSNGASFDAGTYDLSESGPAGYSASAWVCVGGTQNDGDTITLGLGQSAVCTITNDDIAPTIKVFKTVINDNGGLAMEANFSFFLDSILELFHDISAATTAGLHTVSEDSFFGYMQSVWGGDCDEDGFVTLVLGQDATCTVTNDDIAPELTVTKIVQNNNGGAAVADDFVVRIDSIAVDSGVPQTLNAGAYTVSEDDPGHGYVGVVGGDCAADGTVALAPGDEKECTITNTDIAPGLTLIKSVTNDDGGLATAGDFQGYIDEDDVPWGVAQALDAGTYTLSENGPDGYEASMWVCEGGTQNDSEITIGVGETVVCVITNDDIAPTLKLVKNIINDNGGTAVPGDWMLTVGGDGGFSGAGDSTIFHAVKANETYELSESDGTSGYAASSWSCNGGNLDENTITLGLGEEVTCEITNDDIQPTLTVYKQVSDPQEQYESSFFDIFVDLVLVGIGDTNGFDAGTYTVTEDISGNNSFPPGVSFTQEFSGSCGSDGTVTLNVGDEAICTITNTIVYTQFDTTPPSSKFDNDRNHEIIETELLSLTLTGSSTDNFPGVVSGVDSAELKIFKIAGEETILNSNFNSIFHEELNCLNSQGQVPIEIVALNLVGLDPLPLDVTWSHNWAPRGAGVYCFEVHATDKAGNAEHTGVAGPFAYTFIPPAPSPAPAPTPSSEGGGGGPIDGLTFGGGGESGGIVLGASIEFPPQVPHGQVLGVSIEECNKYLTAYIRYGRQNDTSQVLRLQRFLNSLEGAQVNENGNYDQSSLSAVNTFQAKYTNDILVPWGIRKPTGYVYYTTQKKINEIYCKFAKEFPLTESQLAEIARIRALSESGAFNAPAALVSPTGGSETPPASPPASSQSAPNLKMGAAPEVSQAATVVESNKGGFWNFIKRIFGR